MLYTLCPVPRDMSSIAGLPRCLRLEELEADVALIGVPNKSPYDVSVPARHGEGTIPAQDAAAAAAVRRQSQAYAHSSTGQNLVDFSGACLILFEHSDRATYVSGTSRSLAGNPVGENCRSRCLDQRVERHWGYENTGQSCEDHELTSSSHHNRRCP